MTKLEKAILNAKESLSKYSKVTWDIEELTENIYKLLDVIIELTNQQEDKEDKKNEFIPEQFDYELIQGKIMYDINSGRWTIGYLELAAGTIFEILINDKWVKVKMEYDGDKYFLTVPEINIKEGIKGRIRPSEFNGKTKTNN